MPAIRLVYIPTTNGLVSWKTKTTRPVHRWRGARGAADGCILGTESDQNGQVNRIRRDCVTQPPSTSNSSRPAFRPHPAPCTPVAPCSRVFFALDRGSERRCLWDRTGLSRIQDRANLGRQARTGAPLSSGAPGPGPTSGLSRLLPCCVAQRCSRHCALFGPAERPILERLRAAYTTVSVESAVCGCPRDLKTRLAQGRGSTCDTLHCNSVALGADRGVFCRVCTLVQIPLGSVTRWAVAYGGMIVWASESYVSTRMDEPEQDQHTCLICLNEVWLARGGGNDLAACRLWPDLMGRKPFPPKRSKRGRTA